MGLTVLLRQRPSQLNPHTFIHIRLIMQVDLKKEDDEKSGKGEKKFTWCITDKCNICIGNLDDLGLKFGIHLH